ncbi:NitT/TauT family transport system permease protein [Breoghania corrubedonensis]|uniref:NitT/TauT family transport system permease protein n=1 Tax=Breoghania corrubedonensis TaxID=665038 RepID=A0A2T5VE14_9HYPH|nr:ABC transporter permease [Breoghania corrubedonensis]PTW61984.1 NitT/TauT family transport system permease protein [Breoghania corrubedonensis]
MDPDVVAETAEAEETRRTSRRYRRVPTSLLSLALFFLTWTVAAWWAHDPDVPTPFAVAAFMAREAANGDLFYHLSITLARVAAAFVVSMAVGTAIGLAMGQWREIDRWLDPWLILLINMPALVLIVLCYIWIGLSEAAAITAVALNKTPNVVITLREGARALDPKLAEMARVYRFSRLALVRDVMLPQLQPYIAAASRSGLALIWKIVLVVELLGRSNGVGFQIHLYFQLFDVTAILGYAFAFVAVMIAIEYMLVQPLETRLTRWRAKPA